MSGHGGSRKLAPSQKIRRTGLHSWFGSNPQIPWRTELASLEASGKGGGEYSSSRSLSQSNKSKEMVLL